MQSLTSFTKIMTYISRSQRRDRINEIAPKQPQKPTRLVFSLLRPIRQRQLSPGRPVRRQLGSDNRIRKAQNGQKDADHWWHFA